MFDRSEVVNGMPIVNGLYKRYLIITAVFHFPLLTRVNSTSALDS